MLPGPSSSSRAGPFITFKRLAQCRCARVALDRNRCTASASPLRRQRIRIDRSPSPALARPAFRNFEAEESLGAEQLLTRPPPARRAAAESARKSASWPRPSNSFRIGSETLNLPRKCRRARGDGKLGPAEETDVPAAQTRLNAGSAVGRSGGRSRGHGNLQNWTYVASIGKDSAKVARGSSGPGRTRQSRSSRE